MSSAPSITLNGQVCWVCYVWVSVRRTGYLKRRCCQWVMSCSICCEAHLNNDCADGWEGVQCDLYIIYEIQYDVYKQARLIIYSCIKGRWPVTEIYCLSVIVCMSVCPSIRLSVCLWLPVELRGYLLELCGCLQNCVTVSPWVDGIGVPVSEWTNNKYVWLQ